MMTGHANKFRRPAAFRNNIEGVAAIEFALLLPILLVFLVVTAEIVNALEQKRKVVQLTRTLADLTAQGDSESPMSASLMTEVLSSSDPILAPFPSMNAIIEISTVGIYQSKSSVGVYICSVYPKNGVRHVGSSSDITVPTNFQHAGARFVIAEVTMPFRPVFGSLTSKLIEGMRLDFTWSERMFWPVRSGTKYAGDLEIVLPGGAPCP